VLPNTCELVGSDADLDRPLRDSVLQDTGVRPVDRLPTTIVVGLVVLVEPIVHHPVEHLIYVGTFKNVVPGRPVDRLLLGDEDLRLKAGLGKRLLGGDAIAVDIVAPYRKRWRDDDELRWRADTGYVRCCARQNVPRAGQGSALQSIGC